MIRVFRSRLMTALSVPAAALLLVSCLALSEAGTAGTDETEPAPGAAEAMSSSGGRYTVTSGIAYRPALGVVFAGNPRLESGLPVQHVPDASNAHGYLRNGDLVTGLEGRPLEGWEEFYSTIYAMRAGEMITADVIRDGESIAVSFPLPACRWKTTWW